MARRRSCGPEPFHSVTFNSAGAYVSGFGSSLNHARVASRVGRLTGLDYCFRDAAAVSDSRYCQTTECMITKGRSPGPLGKVHGVPT